jgi:hypothetical protein
MQLFSGTRRKHAYNSVFQDTVDAAMPQTIPHIDAIAREKNRDVLFIHFEHFIQDEAESQDSVRQEVLAWLDANEIEFYPCMGLEEEGLVNVYAGDIYVDVPYDESDETYLLLRDTLEDEEGNMLIDGVLFFSLSLGLALELEAERTEAASPMRS